jgi:hypothetical protein
MWTLDASSIPTSIYRHYAVGRCQLTSERQEQELTRKKVCQLLSETEFLVNSQQAMDHSCYFPTQWTHTESTHIHSRLPKRLHMWKQDSLKNLKDSRNSSLNRQTPRSHFPPSVSDIKDQQPSPNALSSAQTSCSIGFGMTEPEQLICAPWTPERPLKHGMLPKRERG